MVIGRVARQSSRGNSEKNYKVEEEQRGNSWTKTIARKHCENNSKGEKQRDQGAARVAVAREVAREKSNARQPRWGDNEEV